MAAQVEIRQSCSMKGITWSQQTDNYKLSRCNSCKNIQKSEEDINQTYPQNLEKISENTCLGVGLLQVCRAFEVKLKA